MTAASIAVVNAHLDDAGLEHFGVTIWRMSPVVERALGKKVNAITIGSRILVSSSHFQGVIDGSEAEILAHELVHVGQWRSFGWIGFPIRYVTDYVKLRLVGLNHDQAYRGIGFEFEAYAVSSRIVSER